MQSLSPLQQEHWDAVMPPSDRKLFVISLFVMKLFVIMLFVIKLKRKKKKKF